MKPYRSALVALVLTATAALPCAAQQAPSTPQALAIETCAGCFAYLVFSPSLEPEIVRDPRSRDRDLRLAACRRRAQRPPRQSNREPARRLQAVTASTGPHPNEAATMTMHDRLWPAPTALRPASLLPLAGSIASVGARIAEWLATAADYCAAAAIVRATVRAVGRRAAPARALARQPRLGHLPSVRSSQRLNSADHPTTQEPQRGSQ